ncbi:NBR1-Ig-like domain-containing protein [Leptolinea tardivitalis]|uniref:Nbr1 FW domain-containing protein n=1 Tax=Leptolinea tardivitalis TaxID=229920 RepID=A0A0P6WMX9_9CHLR|nr:NBR1-Ig-like domain-containing protein [Leptolinea tardivitalis]KPL71332.1 hypothetical protein ADM99_11580 [Leptolinea tardivitalis]GAP23110.1 hypothetical protein LTAR_03355 [Leptolinea tardivitalis]
MKNRILILSVIILTLSLQSCSSIDKESSETSAAQIYTSVAASLTAQSASKPTSTITPENTATIIPTKETLSIPTLAQVAITSVSDSLVCDNAAYIGDVTIPDGTIVSPGETFTKTWRVQNTGSCNWNTSYMLVFNSGETMGGKTTAVPYVVSSGNQMDISVSLTAPTDLGTYVGYWKLQNSSGTIFGQTLYVQITVATSTATSTLTPTATEEATLTPTQTVAAATATTVPTSTSEIVVEPTATVE